MYIQYIKAVPSGVKHVTHSHRNDFFYYSPIDGSKNIEKNYNTRWHCKIHQENFVINFFNMLYKFSLHANINYIYKNLFFLQTVSYIYFTNK